MVGSRVASADRRVMWRRTLDLERHLLSAPLRRPEEWLVLLVDGDAVAIRIGHGEGSSERAVERLGNDANAGCDHSLIQRLRVACPPPELDARGFGRWTGLPWSTGRRERERRPAHECDGVGAEVERVANGAEVLFVERGGPVRVGDSDRDETGTPCHGGLFHLRTSYPQDSRDRPNSSVLGPRQEDR